MAIYDGQDDKILADCHTIVDAILLPSLVVATPNGGIDYDQFIAQIAFLLQHGGTKIDMLTIKKVSQGIEYRYGLWLPNDQGELMMHAIGIVENGMVVRIEPQGEAVEHYTAVWGTPKMIGVE
jgi:hypothetical protein